MRWVTRSKTKSTRAYLLSLNKVRRADRRRFDLLDVGLQFLGVVLDGCGNGGCCCGCVGLDSLGFRFDLRVQLDCRRVENYTGNERSGRDQNGHCDTPSFLENSGYIIWPSSRNVA